MSLMVKKQTHVPYAIVAALIIIVLGVALYLAGLAFEDWAQYAELVPYLIIIILNAIAYSKANEGYVTFGNVFGSGFKLSLIVAVIMAAWGVVSLMIFPEMKEKSMEMAEQKLMDRGYSEEQIEANLEMTRKYFGLFVVIALLFMHIFWGAIFSLIGAAVAKKKGERPPQFDLQ